MVGFLVQSVQKNPCEPPGVSRRCGVVVVRHPNGGGGNGELAGGDEVGGGRTRRGLGVAGVAVGAVQAVAAVVNPAAIAVWKALRIAWAGEDLLVFDVGIDGVHPFVIGAIIGGQRLIAVIGARHRLIGVLHVLQHGEPDLSFIGSAAGLTGFFSGLGEDRKEDRREQGNDGDHDEELDQCKTVSMEISHIQPKFFVWIRTHRSLQEMEHSVFFVNQRVLRRSL